MLSRLAMFDGFRLEAVWLDVEQAGLTQADIDRDLALIDSYTGRLTGCYTGKWYFDQQGWSQHTWWSDRPLWDSNYTGVPEVGSGFKPYGGWTWPTITQFQGTSAIGSVQQIDLNVMA